MNDSPTFAWPAPWAAPSTLVDLDALPYDDYLATPEWQRLTQAAHRRSKGFCERCQHGRHEQTHHLRYPRSRRDTTVDDLIGICRRCHAFVSGVAGATDPLLEPATLRPSPPLQANPPASSRAIAAARAFTSALEASPASEALRQLDLPSGLAGQLGLGWAAPGRWPGTNPARGRLTFPLTTREATVSAVAGWSLGYCATELEIEVVHGAGGLFLAATLAESQDVAIAADPRDALLLHARGVPAIAICDFRLWHLDWALGLHRALLVADLSAPGMGWWWRLAGQLRRHGITVEHVQGLGRRSLAEAWIGGDHDLVDDVARSLAA
jgi:hypothetical protein